VLWWPVSTASFRIVFLNKNCFIFSFLDDAQHGAHGQRMMGACKQCLGGGVV